MPRKNVRHGEAGRETKTPEYQAWVNAKSRCFNRKDPRFKNYGGRGISMFKPWRRDFRLFLAHIGRRPSAEHSLDRFPDNDGDYKPGNVRWATHKQQQNNRRNNLVNRLRIETEWSKIHGS